MAYPHLSKKHLHRLSPPPLHTFEALRNTIIGYKIDHTCCSYPPRRDVFVEYGILRRNAEKAGKHGLSKRKQPISTQKFDCGELKSRRREFIHVIALQIHGGMDIPVQRDGCRGMP